MPVTPLHFGPALLVREVVGKKNFGICAFATTQVAFDAEPAIRMLFDLEGTLHQTTHNATFGLLYALAAILLCWRWEKIGAVVGAVFGSVTHLWLDAIYHSDVAVNMAKFVNTETAREAGTDAEVICAATLLIWLVFRVVRFCFSQCVKERA